MPTFPVQAVLHERSGRGRLGYLGLDVNPRAPERGQTVEVTHYLRVEEGCAGDYTLFLHGEVPGVGRVLIADLRPSPTSRWQKGEVHAARAQVTIPKDLVAGVIELRAGMRSDDVRLTVEAPAGGSDGQDRINVGTLRLAGAAPAPAPAPAPGGAQLQAGANVQGGAADGLPTAIVRRTRGKIAPDGVLDEPDWGRAEVLTFSDSLGRPQATRYPTRLRLLYDDENLYVGFEATDEDITERFSKRDDPIYDHEAVEVFLMPGVVAPALGPYVELQASPGGVIFDAAFTARRQGMDVSFSAGQTVGTKIDGTLNDSRDSDHGWVSEWAVPWKSIRGVSAAPKSGEEWRMNAFRIEKAKTLPNGEYTAWSPPLVGDFHNTARFGRMKFE